MIIYAPFSIICHRGDIDFLIKHLDHRMVPFSVSSFNPSFYRVYILTGKYTIHQDLEEVFDVMLYKGSRRWKFSYTFPGNGASTLWIDMQR